MNIGDRVRGPGGPGVYFKPHYEPVSLGTRNVRRIAFMLIHYDDGTAQFVPPRDVQPEGEPMTTETPVPEPDPTPPQPEPVEGDDDTEKLIEWP